MSEVSTYRWSFEQDLFHYAAAGYEAIGVWRHKLSDFGEEEGVDLLAETGMRVSHLMWAGGFTGSDGRSLNDAIDDGLHAIRLAGATNAGCLIVFPGGRNNHILSHAERLFRIALDNLISLAEAAEVTLAIKPMHLASAREWTFLTDLESTIALIESINSPHLKLVLDTYHFGHDQAVIANLREIVPHLALVQLGDRQVPPSGCGQRCPLGEGVIPLGMILAELLEAGYTGDFDVDLSNAGIQPRSYQQVLSDSRQQFQQWMPSFSKTA